MMILFWLFIGFGIYYIYNKDIAKVKMKNETTPDDMLRERYVNGEIDEATFEKMKKTISR